nr:hypothetical protein AUSP0017_00001 [Siphoviridae sp. ctekg1]
MTNELSSNGVGVDAPGKGLPAESVVPIVPIDSLVFQNSIPFLVSSMIFLLSFQICNVPLTIFSTSPRSLIELSRTSALIIPTLMKLATISPFDVIAMPNGPFTPLSE